MTKKKLHLILNNHEGTIIIAGHVPLSSQAHSGIRLSSSKKGEALVSTALDSISFLSRASVLKELNLSKHMTKGCVSALVNVPCTYQITVKKTLLVSGEIVSLHSINIISPGVNTVNVLYVNRVDISDKLTEFFATLEDVEELEQGGINGNVL